MTSDTIAMPSAEEEYLLEAYRAARIILEYGSGGSTKAACQMPGKLIFSVESDLDWTRTLRREVAALSPVSPVILEHVDIGATGPWGRVRDESGWRRYHAYPNQIWDRPYFRHPDLILIDGRFRVACLMTALLRAEKPIRVLFDDYAGREAYGLAERVVKPVVRIGRMAEFRIGPGMVKPADIGFIISQYFRVTVYCEGKPSCYDLTEDERRGSHLGAQQMQEDT